MTDEKKQADPPATDKWADALKTSRETTKWVAVSLGAVGVAIFGGIPALKGLNFVWGDDSDNLQMWLAVASALVGLTGIIVVIVMVARAMLPVYSTLSRLSAPTLRAIEKTPRDFLPDGIPSVRALRDKINELDRAVVLLRNHARSIENADANKAAEAAVDDAIGKRDTLRSWADGIRNLDAFNQTQNRLMHPGLFVATGAAAVGAVAFMFLTIAPPDEAKEEATAGDLTVGQVAYLAPIDAVAWGEIIANTTIAGCADDQGRFLVLVRAFSDDVYSVQTLPNNNPVASSTEQSAALPGDPACQAWELEIRPDVASITVLAKPRTLTVEYTPAPSVSPRT